MDSTGSGFDRLLVPDFYPKEVPVVAVVFVVGFQESSTDLANVCYDVIACEPKVGRVCLIVVVGR